LVRLFEKHPGVVLTIFGESLLLDEFKELKPFLNRIEIRQLVPLSLLQKEIARFDINIAPLELKPFCHAKSELKYFEAALLEIPTIASQTITFQNIIDHGKNGFLAQSANEWFNLLEMLVNDKKIRDRTGRNAFTHVLWHFSPQQRMHATFSLLEKTWLNKNTSLKHQDLWTKASLFKQDSFIYGPAKMEVWPKIRKYTIIKEYAKGKYSAAGAVIPLYNYQDYIIEALESVKNQSLKPIDLVVVDDCSTDQSSELTLAWFESNHQHFNRCALLRNDINFGLGATRNTGIDFIQSQYIMLLDADNVLLPTCMEECLAEIKNSGASMVYPGMEIISQTGKVMNNSSSGFYLSNSNWDPERLSTGNYIDAMSMISIAAWAKTGGFSVDFKNQGWEDYEFWLRFVEHGLFGVHLQKILAKYRRHNESMLRHETIESYNAKFDEVKALHAWIKYSKPEFSTDNEHQ